MNIYLLRHGESEFNANASKDRLNCSLTEKGVEQSKIIEQPDSISLFDLVLCSPLVRCQDTLRHSRIQSKQIEINELFREIRSGCLSDLLSSNESVLDHETDDDIQQRVDKIHRYLNDLKQTNNYRYVLIVSHADLLWHLTSYQRDEERFGQWLKNAEMIYWKTISMT